MTWSIKTKRLGRWSWVLLVSLMAMGRMAPSKETHGNTTGWVFDLVPYSETYPYGTRYYPLVTGIAYSMAGTLWINMAEGPGFPDDTI